jgi:2-oxo-4-hydroxy-4-carboxy-5-ureidoimidazoline decarboxylase
MTLYELNVSGPEMLVQPLGRCCGSGAWLERIVGRRPFENLESLIAASDEIWWSLNESDWLEAFATHPKIGEKRADQWSSQEQSGMAQASADAATRMEKLNRQYQERFGWIFIICATGKSAGEMLAILEKRLGNDASDEIRISASEHAKITKLRLKKLLA